MLEKWLVWNLNAATTFSNENSLCSISLLFVIFKFPKPDIFNNSMSELTFKSYQYQNGIQMPYYDEIEVLKLIEASYIGWFKKL